MAMRFSDKELIAYVGEENLKISRLITTEEKKILQKLCDEMSTEFGVATAVSDPDGKPVLEYSNFTKLCSYIRGCEEGLKRCKQEACIRGKMAEKAGEPLVYKCHAGITDFIAPIILLNRRIGNIAGGQFLTKPPDTEIYEHFNCYFDEIGIKDKEKALELLSSQYINDPNKIAKLASIYLSIGKLLSNYFHFQVEYGYWKESLLHLNEELEERVKQRTIQLEETVNALKSTQMRLIQQEKLAGIGQLAAGVAHEINNPLGFVISNIETLEKYVSRITEMLNLYQDFKKGVTEGSQDIQSQVEQIEKLETQKKISYIKKDIGGLLSETQDGFDRIAKIVQGLKVFSRIDSIRQLEEYDLNAGIENTLLIAKNEYKYSAEIEKNLGNIPLVQGVGSELNQVLLNLVINSAQAIKEKYQDGKGIIRFTTYSDKEYVCCEIEDNGNGIPEQIINRIFEPFFTTKQVGKGTGLGLSISHDIVVNKHGGELLVESEVGVGTKFILKLPVMK